MNPPIEIKEGQKRLDLESGLIAYVNDDGSVEVGDVEISNDEFREIAALRHTMKN